MQTVLIVAVAFHVLAGVFWAGSTFVLARNPETATQSLSRAQLGAALITIVAGAVLWSLVRLPAASPSARVLVIGMACALLAAAVQVSLLPAKRGGTAAGLIGLRTAAGLLAVTVITMAVARFA